MVQEKGSKNFEQIFREYYKPLCDFAYNILHDKDLAKDSVQEVFLKLWKNREQVEMGDSIKHYLFKAASHTCLNHLRFNRKIIRLENNSLFQIAAYSTTEEAGYKELELRTREAIDKLPPKCKMVYLLSRQEGLKYNEIAETLNISVKTVENQMGIALEKLRNDLKPFLSREFLAIAAFVVYLVYEFLS